MANESVIINGTTIGRTTALNNTQTVFNSNTDYIFIGRLDSNGVLQIGFRVKLTDLAEDYAAELLQDIQVIIANAKEEIEGKVEEAEEAATSAASSKNQAESAKNGAQTAEANVETLKAQIEALISQMQNIAQTKAVFPVMIEGEQFGLSMTIDDGETIFTLSEIEPSEEETA